VESRDRVFDAFYTTTMAVDDDGVAGPGTGLGLKIVADVAGSYGGHASIGEPSEGYGCRFEFRILAAGANA
jgi:signal transduction histidine kinase